MAAAQQPENVLAALSLMDVAGLKPVGKGLENFIGLPHRRQVIKSGWGLTFIDDSKATNVSAACAALYEMSAKTVLIAGGDGKGQDFKPLAQTARGRVRLVCLIGKDAPLLKSAFAAESVATLNADDMDDAVSKAVVAAKTGDAVLLSPACSSLDMFDDYRARAAAFARAARAVGE